MIKNYFEVVRAGINTTFQDQGRKNLYHIGIPFSGAMDNRNYLIANKLVGNELDLPVLEFAYQGPLLKYFGDKINIAITGDVNFTIKKNNEVINGNCYESFSLENCNELDITSRNRSVYGYLAVRGGFEGEYFWGSCSVNIKAKIGANGGEKYTVNDKLYLNHKENEFNYTLNPSAITGSQIPTKFSGSTINVQGWKGFDIEHPSKEGHRLRHI